MNHQSAHEDQAAIPSVSRRDWLTCAAGATAAVAWQASSGALTAAAAEDADWKVKHGRIKQSACLWCFKPLNVEELARAAVSLGIPSVELVPPQDWNVLKKHNLVCAITSSHGFVKGWNHKEHHDYCRESITKALEATGAAGFPNVITFSGMREKLSDEEGKRNTVAGLKSVIGLAEKLKVNLCLEPLNTRVDVEMKGHPGYQCDTVEWAIDVCKQIGSPRMKILFDIYHTQIMQGDLIVRIKQYKDYIAHYHTAGVPGRNELSDTQEINYPAVMKTIAETGYQGYVGQEFIPTWEDKVAALRHAVKLCDV